MTAAARGGQQEAHDSDGREPSTVMVVWVDGVPFVFDGSALTYTPQLLTATPRGGKGASLSPGD